MKKSRLIKRFSPVKLEGIFWLVGKYTVKIPSHMFLK
jgi:hypothetical protein